MIDIKTKIKNFKEPLYLESGRILEDYDIAYQSYGKINKEKNNIIIICHPLTGSQNASGISKHSKRVGWWDKLIGENKAINTKEYFVICTNILASCFGSTGPMSKNKKTKKYYRFNFPVISIKDMVKAQIIFLRSLGINKVEAIIGGSLGGMQALHYAVDFPKFAKKIIILASSYETKPFAIAFNKITQEAILKDPKFKNGNYKVKDIKKEGLNGLSIGRMAGHISFLSHSSMNKKFGRKYVNTDGLFELFGRFEVENYLKYNAYNFSKNFDPLSYLYIIKAMNIYDISRNYNSLKDALSNISSKLYLFGFTGDILFSPKDLEYINKIMKTLNKPSKYYEIKSDYGHDSFLIEIEKFEDKINHCLKD